MPEPRSVLFANILGGVFFAGEKGGRLLAGAADEAATEEEEEGCSAGAATRPADGVAADAAVEAARAAAALNDAATLPSVRCSFEARNCRLALDIARGTSSRLSAVERPPMLLFGASFSSRIASAPAEGGALERAIEGAAATLDSAPLPAVAACLARCARMCDRFMAAAAAQVEFALNTTSRSAPRSSATDGECAVREERKAANCERKTETESGATESFASARKKFQNITYQNEHRITFSYLHAI